MPKQHAIIGRSAKAIGLACLALAAALTYRPRANAEVIASQALGALDVATARVADVGPRSVAPNDELAVSPQIEALYEERFAPALVGVPALLAPPPPAPQVLKLERLATRERTDLTPFDSDGKPVEAAMTELSTLLAPRALKDKPEERVDIDPRLAELLMRIQYEANDRPIMIISGHREAGRGTSKKSYHVRGMAVDITIPGMKTRDLQKAAVRAGARGIGLYGAFVHVDVREEPYRWGLGGGGRRRR